MMKNFWGQKSDVTEQDEFQDYESEEEIKGLSDLYIPEESLESVKEQEDVKSNVPDCADALLEKGKISPDQLEQVRKEQKLQPDREVEYILSDLNIASQEDILMAKGHLCGFEFIRLQPDEIDEEAFSKLEVDFIKENSIIPLKFEDEKLLVGTSEPANVFAIEHVKRKTGMDVETYVCPADDIEAVCDHFEQSEQLEYCVDDLINDMDDVEVVQDEDEVMEDLEEMAGQSPVIKFVNYLISNAINEGASDIHIEPKPKETIVRYRIDGVLFRNTEAPVKMHPAIVSRIKIMSNLDISERRLPQDGKISVKVGGRGIDLRVSTLPTSHGEKVVIRVLDSQSILRGLDELGMEEEVKNDFEEQIKLPHGIFLVTGPTGSGKSTTLYTALSQMDGETMNISTVEDPVEYELGFCNQVQAVPRIGMTFAAALKSLLRQDPDIIMLGEIRDNETAKIAVQAALTGHLVLSTLHTNDAPSSISRLVNIGVDEYLIAASLNAVLAQRLVRKICPHCKEEYEVPDKQKKYLERAKMDTTKLYKGKGCEKCRDSGYIGRVGIYELLLVDDNFRDMINKDPSVTHMRKVFYESGQNTLFQDGMKKVEKGLTSIDEVLRVTEASGV